MPIWRGVGHNSRLQAADSLNICPQIANSAQHAGRISRRVVDGCDGVAFDQRKRAFRVRSGDEALLHSQAWECVHEARRCESKDYGK
jgi:hypothetical protein